MLLGFLNSMIDFVAIVGNRIELLNIIITAISYGIKFTPQTVVYRKGSEFPQKFLIYQLGGGYEMINLM